MRKKVNANIKIGIRDNCALPFIHSYKLDTAKYSEKEKHVMTWYNIIDYYVLLLNGDLKITENT